jgi:hypothetical protein
MSDRISAEIWIGGNIPEAIVPDLCAAITDEGVALEWAESSFQPKTVGDLRTSLRENDKHVRLLWLCDDQASWGQFENLERFLREHQIPFTRRTEGRYEYDPEIVEYRPVYGAITLAANHAGQPTVVAADLEPVEHLLDVAIKLAETDSGANIVSLMQTALKLLREQLPRPLPPLEPFSIEPTCGSEGGEDDAQEETEEAEADEENQAVAGG